VLGEHGYSRILALHAMRYLNDEGSLSANSMHQLLQLAEA
jgi:hypothetical protein